MEYSCIGAVTKSGTGTWDAGRGDSETWDSGTWDSGTWDSGTWDLGLGTWGREIWERLDLELGDARTSGLGDAWGLEDVINKQHLNFALDL